MISFLCGTDKAKPCFEDSSNNFCRINIGVAIDDDEFNCPKIERRSNSAKKPRTSL